MGSVSNIIIDEQKQKIKAVLIKFDNETIGEDAKKQVTTNTSTKMQFQLKKSKYHFL